jgi:hydrogenase maturation protein HypF
LDIDPEIVACDMHPDYLSTRFAETQTGVHAIRVQHHHAHIVSCMAENRIDGPVIGLAFDGTGYGADGCIWGGEVLIAETGRFERAAHLAYVPMPGSAAAIKEPWRMAVSYLYQTYGEKYRGLDLSFVQTLDRRKADVVTRMIDNRLNTPLTSSLGRLFDGVAAMTGLRNRVAYEGQAAMELEMIAGGIEPRSYDFQWETVDGVHQILTGPIIRGIVQDLETGRPAEVVSARFHATIVGLFAELCDRIRRDTGLNRVALSGGCFQNVKLLTDLLEALKRKKFQVYTHTLVPANDGGVSLGQAVAAAEMVR